MRRFRIRYYIREALYSFRRSGFMAAVSAGVIAVAVMAMAAYWLAYQNTQHLMEQLGGRIEVVVFFEEGLPVSQAEETAIALRKLPGAKMVTLISPDTAKKELMRDSELARYLELLENNPLPASARIILKSHTPELVRAFAARAAELNGVDSVDYGDKAAETFLNILRGLRWLSLVIGGVLTAAALLIVSNVIRLTVFARREEISIMQLVGASPLFIRAPYVLEGCITGLMGGSAAAGLLFGLGLVVNNHLREELSLDLSGYMAVGLDASLISTMIILGIGLGFLGSLTAVGKYLR